MAQSRYPENKQILRWYACWTSITYKNHHLAESSMEPATMRHIVVLFKNCISLRMSTTTARAHIHHVGAAIDILQIAESKNGRKDALA